MNIIIKNKSKMRTYDMWEFIDTFCERQIYQNIVWSYIIPKSNIFGECAILLPFQNGFNMAKKGFTVFGWLETNVSNGNR